MNVIFSIFAHVVASYVWMRLWNWFAVPSFGLPAPSFAMWVGLNYLLDVLAFQFLTQEKFEAAMVRANESRVGHYTKKMLGYATLLGFGYVTHLLVQWGY